MTWSPTIAAVKQAAADHFGMPVTALDANRKDKTLARARKVAVKASANLTSKSLVQIGRSFGGRDHSTIRSALLRFDEEAAKDHQLLDDLETITLKVTQGANPRLRDALKDVAEILAPLVVEAIDRRTAASAAAKQLRPQTVVAKAMPTDLQAAIDEVVRASTSLESARFTSLERSARAALERKAAALRRQVQKFKTETTHG